MAWHFLDSVRATEEGGSMRRIAFVLISAVAAVVMTATSALADSPHFIFANNSIDTSNGALSTSFKDAGLGTGVSSIAITLKADATATYQCYNKAGNKPEGKPKSFGPTGVSASGNFAVRHGQTTGTLEAGPLGPGTFSCPSGQVLFLDGVSYSNTFVSDATGNTFHATPDPVSATLHIRV
jgi:hypothetical protein